MHVKLGKKKIKVEQIRALEKSRLVRKQGRVSPEVMNKIGLALLHPTGFF